MENRIPTMYPYQPLMENYYEGGNHAIAIRQFAAWLKAEAPGVYSKVNGSRPDLLNAAKAVSRGFAGLSGGLGAGELVGEPTLDNNPVTSWGNQLLDLAKGYMTYENQRDIVKLNISRAERGLPPISASSIAPQFNVGASPEVQQLGYVAIAAMVAFGIFTAFKGSRRRR